MSSLFKLLAIVGLIPMTNGNGDPQKSIRELGNTGINVC